MSAYVIVDIDITDPVGYEEYRRLASPTVSAYDGKYVVRGGKNEVLEGEWTPRRLVILEFPTSARAKEWLHSPEYSAIKHIRHQCAKSNMVVVEGV